MDEHSYELGSLAAWRAMLGECLRHLGYESSEARATAWILEREAAVSALRAACDDHGDNDWPDDLHLADVIDKHLVRHLTHDTGANDAQRTAPRSPSA